MKFNDFEREYTNLFNEKKYQEAIDLLNQAENILPREEYKENKILLQRDLAIIYHFNEESSKALETFEMIINTGYSLPENLIGLLPMKDDPKFQALEKRNNELIEIATQNAKLEYKVILPKDYDENKLYPVFFNVHGDGMDGNIKDQMKSWKPEPMLDKGYIVVYPQSSQTYCTNGHGWMRDKELSRKEIKICYDEVCEKYSVDKDHVILAGFSGGADAVVDFSIHQVFPVKGFISLCPTRHIKSFTNEQIIDAKDKGIKGCILEGENDISENVKELVDEFNALGLSCQYIINKEVGHTFPSDLEEKVNTIIGFINE